MSGAPGNRVCLGCILVGLGQACGEDTGRLGIGEEKEVGECEVDQDGED